MKRKELLRKRSRLVSRLPDLAETVRGSLLRRLIRHRSGCRICADGGGHPVPVLSISYPGGRNKQISLSAQKLPQVERWVENHQRLKADLEAISELNHQLLRLEE